MAAVLKAPTALALGIDAAIVKMVLRRAFRINFRVVQMAAATSAGLIRFTRFEFEINVAIAVAKLFVRSMITDLLSSVKTEQITIQAFVITTIRIS